MTTPDDFTGPADTRWTPPDTPEAEAWAAITWWHRNRPTGQIGYMTVPGPLGPALITLKNGTVYPPEHVQDARALLGLPRINRTEGEMG